MDREIVTTFDKFESFVCSKMEKKEAVVTALKKITPKYLSNSYQKPFSIFDTPELSTLTDSDTTPRRSGRIANRKQIDYKDMDTLMPRKLRKRTQRITYSKSGGMLRNGKDRYSIRNLFKNPNKNRSGRKNRKPTSKRTTSLKKKNQPTKNPSDSITTPVTKGSLKAFEEIQNEIFEAFKKSYEPQTALVMINVFKEIKQIFDSKKATISGEDQNSHGEAVKNNDQSDTFTQSHEAAVSDESQNSIGSFPQVAGSVDSSVDAVKTNDQPTVIITQAFEDMTITEVPDKIHHLDEMEETVENWFPDGSVENHNNEIQVDVSEIPKTPEALQEMASVKTDHSIQSEQETASNSVTGRDFGVIQESSLTFAEIRTVNMDVVFDDITNKIDKLKQGIVIETSDKIRQPFEPRKMQLSEETPTKLKLKRAFAEIEKSGSSNSVEVDNDNNNVDAVLQEIPHSEQNETNDREPPSGLAIMEVLDGNQNVAEFNLGKMNKIINVDKYRYDDISTKKKADGETSNATDQEAITISFEGKDQQNSDLTIVEISDGNQKTVEIKLGGIDENGEESISDTGSIYYDSGDGDKQASGSVLEIPYTNQTPTETEKNSVMEIDEETSQSKSYTDNSNDSSVFETNDHKKQNDHDNITKAVTGGTDQPSADFTKADITDGILNLVKMELRSVREVDEESYSSVADNFCDTNDDTIVDVSVKSQLDDEVISSEERQESFDLENSDIIQIQAKIEEENDMDIDEVTLQSAIDNYSSDGLSSDTLKDTEQSEHDFIINAFEERDQQDGILEENENAAEMEDENEFNEEADDSDVEVIDEGFLDDVGNYTANTSDEEVTNSSADIEMIYPQEYRRAYQQSYIGIQQYNLYSQFSNIQGFAASRFYAPVHDELPPLHMHTPRNLERMMIREIDSLEDQNHFEISDYIPSPENTQEHRPQIHMSHFAPLAYPYTAFQHQNHRNNLTTPPHPFDSEFQHPISLPNVHPQWSQLYLQSMIQVAQIVSSRIPRPLRDNDGCRNLHYSCSMQARLQINRRPRQDDQRDHQAMLPYNANQQLAQINQMYQQENYNRQIQHRNERFRQEPELFWEDAEGQGNNCRVYDVLFGRLDSMNGRIFRTGSMIIQFGDIRVQIIGDLILNSVYESLAFDAYFRPPENF